MEALRFRLPDLYAAIHASAYYIFSLWRITAGCDEGLESPDILCLYDYFLHQLLVDAYWLRLHIPNSDGAIYGRSNKEVVLLRVPHSVCQSSYVPFCVRHVLNVHVSLDSHLHFGSVSAVQLGLVVRGTAQKVLTIRTERQCPNRVPIKGSKLLGSPQFPVH